MVSGSVPGVVRCTCRHLVQDEASRILRIPSVRDNRITLDGTEDDTSIDITTKVALRRVVEEGEEMRGRQSRATNYAGRERPLQQRWFTLHDQITTSIEFRCSRYFREIGWVVITSLLEASYRVA